MRCSDSIFTFRAPSRLAPALAAALGLLWAAAEASAATGLSHAEAIALARDGTPAVQARQAVVAGSSAARAAADSKPDPRLTLGLENVPAQGPDRRSTTRDPGTMQRLALMQEMPNGAKREARARMAEARIERDRAMLGAAERIAERDASAAWLAVHYAERRRATLADFERQNRLLQDTLGARIGTGMAQPADLTAARQEALMIADRGDDFTRDVARARAELRRWVGPRADEPLAGQPRVPEANAERLRARLPQHAELRPFEPMRQMAVAEMAEAEAEKRGDWSWEIAYSRRPKYDDMVSFMLTFELPWQRERRQQPLADARRREVQRLEAEREDLLRKLAQELEQMLAELQALDAQHARLTGHGLVLADERVTLLTASYQAGRADLGMVLMARTQALEARLRVIELDAMRAALRVRLVTLLGEE
ncbi:MAG: TolC family protein [Rubrivivax sp.]|nr:TolC family protein [Rubrivivax sp.]